MLSLRISIRAIKSSHNYEASDRCIARGEALRDSLGAGQEAETKQRRETADSRKKKGRLMEGRAWKCEPRGRTSRNYRRNHTAHGDAGRDRSTFEILKRDLSIGNHRVFRGSDCNRLRRNLIVVTNFVCWTKAGNYLVYKFSHFSRVPCLAFGFHLLSQFCRGSKIVGNKIVNIVSRR